MVLNAGMTNLTIPRPSILNRLRRRTTLRVTPWDDSYTERLAALHEHEAIAVNLDLEGPAWIEYHQNGNIGLVRQGVTRCFERCDDGQYVYVGTVSTWPQHRAEFHIPT